MLFADYQAYIDCQKELGQAYLDTEHWTEMSILNVARIGKFSSDRSVQEYCEKIWNVQPVKHHLAEYTPAAAELSVPH